ncbi:HAMP domain-containing sensor histidine kinase [Tsukamurella sp. 8F]|uniref:sensor histidine kinase n=1 Tax=unclassified Tsukamurella TaxID=2633480 RepID=UPI0023B8EC31|nr:MULTISPECIES: HAMP domain-containing sensor histidine kinase [unclassified Tsukamurella]MDF0529015.1 HAMP domain-containing sensor histidine kinase [Tsukamurella sp. 8J]MDF0587388.1 HAMP domain-containing sensor histidine kinase [Tsukamurella sp. 8F]
MRRRILLSTVAVVTITGLLLGIPLTFYAWRWVDDTARNDLQHRLQRVSSELIAQEDTDGRLPAEIKVESLKLILPEGGRLTLDYPDPQGRLHHIEVGEPCHNPITESMSLGTTGQIRLQQSRDRLRDQQWQVLTIVSTMVALSIAAGIVVAAMTASRLADPVLAVAGRAERIARGDFRPDPARHGITELDRVSDVLDAVTLEIADRLHRERQIVGEVSHQLRSRLTAVRIRLDELSMHPDPDVVTEADAALDQVDRLTSALTDMVAAARAATPPGTRSSVDVEKELRPLIADFGALYTRVGRRLVLRVADGEPILAWVTPARLRETVAVLIDNALQHGDGTARITVGRAGGTPTVLVTVTDEGPGVSDSDAQKIFERGYSGAGGTGVGLALARAFVEADGGRLQLQNRRPPTFAVFVPAATPDSGEPKAEFSSEPR